MFSNLIKFRESLGLNQKEFAESIGISYNRYNNYERGIREPRSDFWVTVSNKYGVSVDYLMGCESDPALTRDKNELKSIVESLSHEDLLKLIDYARFLKHGQNRE